MHKESGPNYEIPVTTDDIEELLGQVGIASTFSTRPTPHSETRPGWHENLPGFPTVVDELIPPGTRTQNTELSMIVTQDFTDKGEPISSKYVASRDTLDGRLATVTFYRKEWPHGRALIAEGVKKSAHYAIYRRPKSADPADEPELTIERVTDVERGGAPPPPGASTEATMEGRFIHLGIESNGIGFDDGEPVPVLEPSSAEVQMIAHFLRDVANPLNLA